MVDINSFILTAVIFFSYLFFFKKFQILNDNTSSSEHKKLTKGELSPILLGGPYLLTVILIFSPHVFYPIKIIFCLMLILGLMSDKNFLPNPKIRIFIQILLIILIVYNQNLRIDDLRLDVLNSLLSNNIFNICFTVFCLAILINGCNFIDGLNGLLVGYILISFISFFYISSAHTNIILIDQNFLNIFFISLIIFFIFNMFGLIYLGDSGSYIVSLILGIYFIKINSINDTLSPYYIAVILWYPAFENLFSFIRRVIKRKNISKADNQHLHQLFYLYARSRYSFKKENLNTFCSIIILIFNFPGFIISSLYPEKTNILVLILFINLLLYLLFYYFFSKQLKIQK